MPSAIAVPPICALADEQSDDPRDLWRCDQSSGNLQTLTQRFKNGLGRSEEHTSELQSLMRISYAVFCLKNKISQPFNTTASDKAQNTAMHRKSTRQKARH